MNWTNIIDGFIHVVARLVVGRPTYLPTPPRPVPRPSPVPQPTPVPPQPTTDPTTLAGQLLAAINAARTANGLSRLVNDPAVSAVAAAWANRMAATGILEHGNFAGRVATVRPGVAAGETIGEGFASGEDEVQAWANDPSHRAVLLGDWTAVGCGVGIARDGTIYWLADFLKE